MKTIRINKAVIFLLGLFLLTSCQMEKEPIKIGDLSTGDQTSPVESSEIPRETIYAVGDNIAAASLSGIKIKAVQLRVYIISGISSSPSSRLTGL